MAGLPATGVMGCITLWPVNRPVVVKGLNTERAYKRSAVCTLLASFAPIMAVIM